MRSASTLLIVSSIVLVLLGVVSCRSRDKSTPTVQAIASASAANAAPITTPSGTGYVAAPATNGSVAPNAFEPPPGARAVEHPPPGLPEPAAPPVTGGDARAPSIGDIFDGYGLPPHDGLDHLCGRRVYDRTGGHLTWDAFACPLPPEKLVLDFKQRLGNPGFEAHGAGGIWRMPAGAPTPRRTLEIVPAGTTGVFDQCEKKPSTTSKSVLVLSRWF